MKYVIIGNSAAGIGAVEGIRQVDPEGEITIITNERHHTYSRPLISYLLLGKVEEAKMKYRPASFYSDMNCTLLAGTMATGVDAKAKEVILSDDARVPYDRLLVATGSSAFVPPIEGLEQVKNRFTFMDLDSALALDKLLDQNSRVLILGSGLIGLKCAESIVNRTKQVTVLARSPRILTRILDDDGAKKVQDHLQNMGMEFVLSNTVARFEGNTALLNDGSTADFDILVIAMGVHPNVALLDGIAEIDQAIIINGKSETSATDIYAAGDCTQTVDVSDGQSKIMALLPNAYMQGECAGINMAGGEKVFDRVIPMNAVGFFGLQIITAGNYRGEIFAKDSEGSHKRLFYSDNRLNGYVLIGDVEGAGIYTSIIRERIPLDSIDFALVCERPGLMAFTKEERTAKLGS